MVKKTKAVLSYPILALRDIVIYPKMVVPLFVGRELSIKALELAMQTDKKILLVAQKEAKTHEPKTTDLFKVGTLATILQLLRLPDGTVKVLVEGDDRASISAMKTQENCMFAEIQIPDIEIIDVSEERVIEGIRTLVSLFTQYVRLNKKIPSEILSSLNDIKTVDQLVDLIAVHLTLPIDQKQKILETFDSGARLSLLNDYLDKTLAELQLDKHVDNTVKQQIDKDQREYFLKKKLSAIQKELDDSEPQGNEIENYKKRIAKSGMPKSVREKALLELNKLKFMPYMSAESTVSRNYLDCLLDLPWKKTSKVNADLEKAENILNEDHYGLEKVKERILEYLAVQSRVKKLKGPILCLVGPPGVGKTSLGRSIARATGREFVRMSLGGVRDEAEIRGHRRTYIGALPGKIIHNLSKVGVRNPLFLLDEIDKMAMDFRGDPASALLEVLDPEQNNTFNDHYLEAEFDLSDIMFVTTANTQDIPPALLDRMEIIDLSGYTEDEKLNIAKKHLVPKQLEQNGLTDDELKFSDAALTEMIQYYTREAGVRSLERQIAKVCRKVVKKLAADKKISKAIAVTPKNIEGYLGVHKFHFGKAEEENKVGQVTGLAWTEVGGELLNIEAAVMPGKGNNLITGQIGEVMQESIQAAITIVKSRSETLGVHPDVFEQKDLHIHVPEGAIPKDGPSAGIAMCTTVVSVLTGIPVRSDVAMTGEITLRGEILPIGGLKEKLLAARRGGIKHVIIPLENKKDLKEIPDNIKNKLEIHPVRWIDEVFKLALEKMPKPLSEKALAKSVKTQAALTKKTPALPAQSEQTH